MLLIIWRGRNVHWVTNIVERLPKRKRALRPVVSVVRSLMPTILRLLSVRSLESFGWSGSIAHWCVCRIYRWPPGKYEAIDARRSYWKMTMIRRQSSRHNDLVSAQLSMQSNEARKLFSWRWSHQYSNTLQSFVPENWIVVVKLRKSFLLVFWIFSRNVSVNSCFVLGRIFFFFNVHARVTRHPSSMEERAYIATMPSPKNTSEIDVSLITIPRWLVNIKIILSKKLYSFADHCTSFQDGFLLLTRSLFFSILPVWEDHPTSFRLLSIVWEKE